VFDLLSPQVLYICRTSEHAFEEARQILLVERETLVTGSAGVDNWEIIRGRILK